MLISVLAIVFPLLLMFVLLLLLVGGLVIVFTIVVASILMIPIFTNSCIRARLSVRLVDYNSS